MGTPLNTEYETLTVYFYIHAFMALQFKPYSPKFTNRLITPTNNLTISESASQRNTQSNP